MALAKNIFIKSKMNKDLDERLVGKGEYRDAQNINVSRSEGDDVGSVENVLGNELIVNLTSSSASDNKQVIGQYVDQTSERAFFYITDHLDNSSDNLSGYAGKGSTHMIVMRDLVNNTTHTLVSGRFLNFSITHPIINIDLIEDLLFWTDDRNQPRKINIEKALADATHYTTEDNISVAKYNPYNAISLVNSFTVTVTSGTLTGAGPFVVSSTDYAKIRQGQFVEMPNTNNSTTPCIIQSTSNSNSSFTLNQNLAQTNSSATTLTIYETGSKNVSDKFTEQTVFGTAGSPSTVSGSIREFTVSNLSGNLYPSMRVFNSRTVSEIIITELPNYTLGDNTATVRCSASLTELQEAFQVKPPATNYNALVYFADANSQYLSNFAGDKEYLRDKFVRFSYRFKFEDGEYSLIAPFTSPAFVPKQNGHIVDENQLWDTSNANSDQGNVERGWENIAKSTVVEFFENSVNVVDLNIQFPFAVNQLNSKLKIEEIDILYKESDNLAVRILETIPYTDTRISSNSTTTLSYEYDSTEPFRPITEAQLVRVFDRVPIRAKTQSVTGNRVVYGNFLNKHTPPENLDYRLEISKKYLPKEDTGGIPKLRSNLLVKHPTASVKQNRTYQVGIILADRYGRQTDVILSSSDANNVSFSGGTFGSDTIFYPYFSSARATTTPVASWFGDSLKVLFKSVIPNSVSYASGYPGLYKPGDYTGTCTTSSGSTTTLSIKDFDQDPEVGDIITIGADDYAIKSVNITYPQYPAVPSAAITLDSAANVTLNSVYNIVGKANPLGFYTYKVVIKQLQQEYYNTYLGNVISGGFKDQKDSTGTLNEQGIFRTSISYASLFGDNINKIPADLGEVEPNQQLFATNTTKLFPRVSSTVNIGDTGTFTKQFFVGNNTISKSNPFVTGIFSGKLTDLKALDLAASTPLTGVGFVNAQQDPIGFKFNTNGEVIGVPVVVPTYVNTSFINSDLRLNVMEVEPPKSNIEIYYETACAGLIRDLNILIETGDDSSSTQPAPPPNDDAVAS
tara:strand:+ start:3292 stop:6351 length:3060 start_codon:yes stop_codon:yes gene_type:complete